MATRPLDGERCRERLGLADDGRKPRARPLFALDGRAEGASSPDGRVQGSYLHGLFGSEPFRAAFLASLGATSSGLGYEAGIDATLDALADHIERHLDCDGLLALAAEV